MAIYILAATNGCSFAIVSAHLHLTGCPDVMMMIFEYV